MGVVNAQQDSDYPFVNGFLIGKPLALNVKRP